MTNVIKRFAARRLHLAGRLRPSRLAVVPFIAAVALLWGAAPAAQAQVDLPIYTDAPLVNGWQNWSWATVQMDSTAITHGGTTAIAVSAGAWTALALRHEPFSTTGYGNLTFWINGGVAGHTRLFVVPTLNDVNQPGLSIGPIAANTWQRISIPLTSLGIQDVANFTGFWIQEGTGSDQTLNPFFVDDITLTSAIPLVPPPPLQGGMALYDDAYVNGWDNWSWATVNAANPAPVNSGASALAVTAAPYQALRFHHAALDTEGYSSLTFWINGGPVGGQLLSLNALLADVVQPGIAIGPLAPQVWQKVVVPLAALGAADKRDLTDVWLQEIAGVSSPVFFVDDVRLDLSPPPAVVNVVVDATERIRRVDARTFGLNTAIWDGTFDTATTRGLLAELDNKALRFPGGSASDEYHWKTNMSEGQTFQWATSFDAFARTATFARSDVFITVNYGTGTPQEAADWVRYSNLEKGYGFKYWEVGNENYGTWEADNNNRPHDPVTYATRFVEYASQMKAVDPSVRIGAVIQASEDSNANYNDQIVVNPRTGLPHAGWSAVMLATFNRLGFLPDFVAYHRYEQAPGGENDAYLLNASRGWAQDAVIIRQLLNDYLGTKAARRVEITSTETNSVYSNPGKQSTSLVNGLFLADSIGNIMKTEFNSFFWWDLRNGADPGNNSPLLYGWRRYGDYGIINGNDPAGPADRYPTFYVYKLLKHYARGGETVVAADSDYNRLGVYAVRDRHARTLNLLLINKHPISALTASVQILGFKMGATAEIYSYGIPQDEAARTGIGSADIAQTTVSALTAPTFAFTPPPYSATVIRISKRDRRPSDGHGHGDHHDDDDDDDDRHDQRHQHDRRDQRDDDREGNRSRQ